MADRETFSWCEGKELDGHLYTMRGEKPWKSFRFPNCANASDTEDPSNGGKEWELGPFWCKSPDQAEPGNHETLFRRPLCILKALMVPPELQLPEKIDTTLVRPPWCTSMTICIEASLWNPGCNWAQWAVNVKIFVLVYLYLEQNRPSSQQQEQNSRKTCPGAGRAWDEILGVVLNSCSEKTLP